MENTTTLSMTSKIAGTVAAGALVFAVAYSGATLHTSPLSAPILVAACIGIGWIMGATQVKKSKKEIATI